MDGPQLQWILAVRVESDTVFHDVVMQRLAQHEQHPKWMHAQIARLVRWVARRVKPLVATLGGDEQGLTQVQVPMAPRRRTALSWLIRAVPTSWSWQDSGEGLAGTSPRHTGGLGPGNADQVPASLTFGAPEGVDGLRVGERELAGLRTGRADLVSVERGLGRLELELEFDSAEAAAVAPAQLQALQDELNARWATEGAQLSGGWDVDGVMVRGHLQLALDDWLVTLERWFPVAGRRAASRDVQDASQGPS